MTSGCGNPHCPEHGDNEDAKRNRENKARVVANHELMSIIRLLAVNAHAIVAREGDMPEAFATMFQHEILIGNKDDDLVVQGIINGFVVLLKSHYPTQQMFGLCANVPEEENFIAKQQKDVRRPEPRPEHIGPGMYAFTSLEELMAFLKGRL